MVAGPDVATDQTIETLQRALADARAERDAAQAREAALAEVLRAINSARGDLGPVFGAILTKAMTLCDAAFGAVVTYANEHLTLAGHRNAPPALVEFWRTPQYVDPAGSAGRVLREGKTAQTADLAASEAYRKRRPLTVASVELGGIRTMLQVPLVSERGSVGLFVLYRQDVRLFTEQQVALVEAFAAQAALAIENARLTTEQREALEQQTATADILRVISQSPTDVGPVLDAVVKAATRFCGAPDAILVLRQQGDQVGVAAHEGPLTSTIGRSYPANRRTVMGRTIVDSRMVHIPDIDLVDDPGLAGAKELAATHGWRATLSAPMLRDGVAIGAIGLRNPVAGPFTDHQIGVLETFAAQAVIAIENVRLFTELRDSLEQQTATAEVLRVISQSPTEVQPVLEAVAAAAQRFCGAADVSIALRDGAEIYYATHVGSLPATVERTALDPSRASGRAILEGRTIHLHDIRSLDPVEFAGARRLSAEVGFQSSIAAPMMREDTAIGCVLLRKIESAPFTPRQIELLETFAAQAVIAIENVRLFTELREALEQQTATADILRVISQSPTDVIPVLQAVATAAVRFCGADDVAMALRDGDSWYGAAHVGPIRSATGERFPLARETLMGRTLIDGRTMHVSDVRDLDPLEFAGARELAQRLDFRAVLMAPMLHDGTAIGGITLRRRTPGPFNPRQIALLEAFAAQAVIAVENVRLFTELRDSLEQQTATADILRVISQSPTDVGPVLQAVAKAALRFCGAEDVVIGLRDGDSWVFAAHEGSVAANVGDRVPLTRGTAGGHAILDARTVHLPDIAALDPVEYPTAQDFARRQGYRAVLAAPLLREGAAIGGVGLRRIEPGPFTPRQIALLEGFAAQAVIAIENVRLFTELGARNTELSESLEQQTATADILRVISQSPTDVGPVLVAVTKAALRFCGAEDVVIALRDGDTWTAAGHQGAMPGQLGQSYPLNRETAPGRAIVDAAVVHLPSIADLDPVEFATAHHLSRQYGFRAAVAAPMLRDGTAIGSIALRKAQVGAYSPRQIALLESFAAQAVIAIENVRLFTELKESLDQQTATTEILQAINSSPGDLQPVFDTIVDKAMTLCEAAFGMFNTFDGERLHTVAIRGVPEAYARHRLSSPPDYGPGTAPGRLIAGEDCVHVVDLAEGDLYRSDPNRRAIVDLGGARSILNVALRKEGALLGMIAIYRQEVRPFSDKQIALLQSFAAQAVIAMENARLLGELRERTDDLTESLEYQTATSEVLEAIGRSTSDIQPVLDTMLKAALRLCRTESGGIAIQQGDAFRYVATLGWDPPMDSAIRARRIGPARGMIGDRTLLERKIVEIADVETDPDFPLPEIARGYHTALGVPLMRESEPIGVITLTRRKVEPFTERQIGLIRTFADQAVIAMENARLLGELRQRTDDLTESLEYQTATSELLDVISRSAADVQPVLDTMLASAGRLCGVQAGGVAVRQGDTLHYVATLGQTLQFDKWLRETPHAIGRSSGAGRATLEKDVVHIVDIRADPDYAMSQTVDVGKVRTLLSVPLLRDGEAVGAISLTRTQVEPFTERQIALVRTFADQAVIAMENARLLGELHESLEQQTATSDVLKTISRSSVSLDEVLQTLVETVARLCRGDQSYLFRSEGDLNHLIASHGVPDEMRAYVLANPFEPNRSNASGRAMLERRTIHIPDVLADPEYTYAGQQIGGFRTSLGIPLLREDTLLGVFVVTRMRVEPFTDKEIALASGFADQAVIAIENARLFEELRDRQAELRATFDNMGDGVAMFDADLKLASWNRNFQELLDMPDSFLASRPALEDYVRLLVQRGELGDRDPDQEVARYRERAARQWSAERTRPDGRVLEVRNNPVPGGGAVLIYSDITRRKKAEAEIRAARDAAEAALERQTATADILKVIAGSPTDVQPVLEAVAKAAVRFCGATDAVIHLREGSETFVAAHEGPLGAALGRRAALDGGTAFSAAILERRTTQFPDIDALDAAKYGGTRARAAEFGFRAVISAPLLREDSAVGAISLRRIEPGAFTDQQIELLETFAAQAVIAIENVRLFNDLRESLEQQTATAEILRAISQSPTDVQPVLTAVAKAAVRFCGAADALINLRDGDSWIPTAHEGPVSASIGVRFPLNRETSTGRSIIDGLTCHLPNVAALDPVEFASMRRMAVEYGFAAAVAAPLLRDGVAIGAVALRKAEPEPFTPPQISLLETFAAQAVIAIENVRLFTELRESLEQQTATAEILTVISQSPTDVGPVLSAVATAAMKFCGASDAQVALREGDHWMIAAHEGPIDALLGHRALTRHTAPGRAMIDGKVVQIADLQTVDAAEFPEARELGAKLGFRSVLAAPLLREDVTIGAISLRRSEAGEFEPRQVELLKTFAAQAVIAIENVRLFNETKEALERQTATAEILQVIGSSPTDTQPVFEAIVNSGVRLFPSAMITVARPDGGTVRAAAIAHEDTTMVAGWRERFATPLSRDRLHAAAILDAKLIDLSDAEAEKDGPLGPGVRNFILSGNRAVTIMPMLRGEGAIGAISVTRAVPGPLSDKQIAILRTFADQAVIAIENVRLFTELRDSLERLKAAQANLVQSEKMATLGQLTAGIAHEIKNPLNFVNNFASLSVELLDELKEVAGPALATLDGERRAEVDETMSLLISNLGKITEHGKRADGIVKSMLSHSRGGSGDWQPSDINALVEEALNLAYHGARAQDKEFNVTLERDFEKTSKSIEVVPQDVTRVFLNLFGNGFYAANKRRLANNAAGFRPTLKVTTRDLGEMVEVRVRDNGTGIPTELRDKLFQPFFTTKPTGEGTGLGLSISYDIVTQQHGGTIEVASEVGQYTEFTVRLPRSRRVSAERA